MIAFPALFGVSQSCRYAVIHDYHTCTRRYMMWNMVAASSSSQGEEKKRALADDPHTTTVRNGRSLALSCTSPCFMNETRQRAHLVIHTHRVLRANAPCIASASHSLTIKYHYWLVACRETLEVTFVILTIVAYYLPLFYNQSIWS